MSSGDSTFSGFVPPTSNFFVMPNCWTDVTASINSLAELKVIEYVLRHTWGFHEYGIAKAISIEEFMYGRERVDGSRMDNGTGLSRPSVIDGSKRAVAHGYLVCVVDNSDRGRVRKSYALNMRVDDSATLLSDVKDLYSRGKESLPLGSKFFTPSPVKNLYSRGKESLPRTEKETIERHLHTERKKERTEVPPPPATIPLTNSFIHSFDQSFDQFKILMEWLVAENVAMSKDHGVVRDQLKKLAAVIMSREQLHELYLYVGARISGADPTIWLGNLVGNRLQAWLQQRQVVADLMPKRMTKEDADELVAMIIAVYPQMLVGIDGTDGIYSVGIKGPDGWIDITNHGEWESMPQDLIDVAVAYAEGQLQDCIGDLLEVVL